MFTHNCLNSNQKYDKLNQYNPDESRYAQFNISSWIMNDDVSRRYNLLIDCTVSGFVFKWQHR